MLIYTNSYNFLQIYDDLSSTNNTVADKAHTNFTYISAGSWINGRSKKQKMDILINNNSY